MRYKRARLHTGGCGQIFACAHVTPHLTPLSLKHIKSKNQDKISKIGEKRLRIYCFGYTLHVWECLCNHCSIDIIVIFMHKHDDHHVQV